MYVTYEPRQFYKILRKHGSSGSKLFYCNGPYNQPPKPVPDGLPKPDFMPSKLLRVSDMQIVDGSTVNEGYCALSYSWSWCGNNVMDTSKGKAVRVEEGKHKIIWPAKIVPKKPRGRKRIGRTTKFVEFEGIIQQICKDFNVKYIWYDQWCINQSNKEEKIREIKRMHKIYNNAYCAVAMVPELRAIKIKDRNEKFFFRRYADFDAVSLSDWFSRIWTLEEKIMSKKILFVGRNVHFWEDIAKEESDFRILIKRPTQINVAMVLYYAHRRDTTKQHDRLFALANIFPHIMDNLDINYDSPLEEAMVQFYGILAKQDLSILCFGEYDRYRHEYLPREYWYKETLPPSLQNWYNNVHIRIHDLPSWTGVAGEHLLSADIDLMWKTDFKNYNVNGRSLEITSTFISSTNCNQGERTISLQYKDLPPLPTSNVDAWWSLAIKIQLPGHTKSKVFPLFSVFGDFEDIDYDELIESVTKKLQLLSHFLPIDKNQFFWRDSSKAPSNESTKFIFNLTKDITTSSSPQCTLLSGVSFEQKRMKDVKLYPIVQKQDGHNPYYKSIGTCEIDNPDYFFSDYTPPVEKTFIIQ